MLREKPPNQVRKAQNCQGQKLDTFCDFGTHHTMVDKAKQRPQYIGGWYTSCPDLPHFEVHLFALKLGPWRDGSVFLASNFNKLQQKDARQVNMQVRKQGNNNVLCTLLLGLVYTSPNVPQHVIGC